MVWLESMVTIWLKIQHWHGNWGWNWCSQNLDLPTMLVDHLLKTKKEYKNLKKLDKVSFQHDMGFELG